MWHRHFCFFCILSILSSPSFALNRYNPVSLQVDIVADDGRIFPLYRQGLSQQNRSKRAWLEAVHGENYSIRVYNNSDRRVGLVIAVDGRNIISGQKSHLKNHERMYIVDPWQTVTYQGWRTSSNTINRFYFTDVENSYAEAFNDKSAMGVIALAVFPERLPEPRPRKKRVYPYENSAPSAGMEETQDSVSGDRMESKRKSQQAGTGFGQSEYSYARRVHFEPVKRASEKHFLKYEWRQTLCDKRIIQCSPEMSNRFWPERWSGEGFAPYPPLN